MAPKTYQRDAYRRELRTSVTDCRVAGKEFEVELADTVLYPESGGQPSDSGTIDGQPVLGVRREQDGQGSERVWHRVARELAGEVEVRLDWPRRYDHMQQHTAQHVLTSLALDEFGWTTNAFHLGAEHCDLELAADPLDPERLAALQARANEVVRAARPVTIRWAEPEEYARLAVRSRLLPAGFAGPYRLVEIEGVDLNTCGGTHVANTAELQAIALVGTERLRGGTRVFYQAGSRVLAELARAREHQRSLNDLLSCGPGDHPAAVARLQAALAEAGLQGRRLAAELASEIGSRLAEGPQPTAFHRVEGDMAFLQAVARAFLGVRPAGFALLTAGAEGGSGVFVLAGPEDSLRQLGPRVASLLGGRGGGGAGLFQGKATALGPPARAAALALLAEVPER